MGLSNTTTELLAASPYWDDFSANSGYHRILIKPKLPVQTRELNQMQSILQNQIGVLGSGIFKEGAPVSGGNASFANNVLSLQIVRDDNVDISHFFDTTTGYGDTVRGITSGAEGKIVQIDTQGSETYCAVLVAPMTADHFIGSESVRFIEPTTNSTVATMVLAPDPVHVKNAAVFSVQSGVFFLRGHLVNVEQQTIVLSSNTNIVSARVGFEIAETFITYSDDSSLLDPALGSTNYAGPGADRLRLVATLTARPITGSTLVEQNSDEDFIEISRIINGVPSATADRLEPSLIEETLARRTYDESGDYIVRPFRLSTKPHNPPANIPNTTGTITGNTNSTTIVSGGVNTLFQEEAVIGDVIVVGSEQREIIGITSNSALQVNAAFSVDFTNTTYTIASDSKLNLELESGKAYIRGREFETLGTTILEAVKPRTTAVVPNGATSTSFGPYVMVTRANGVLSFNTTEQVDLHSVDFSSINSVPTTYNSTKIGTAYARAMVYYSGNGDANTVYKLYLVGAEYNSKTLSYIGSTDSDTGLTEFSKTDATGVVTLVQNTTTANTSLLSTSNGAYIGSVVAFVGNDGSSLRYVVTASNSTTSLKKTTINLVLSTNAYFDKINTTANVVFSFSDKSIRGIATSNTLTKGATVHVNSKVGNIPSGNTIFQGTDSTSLLFKFRESWIKQNTITDQQFTTLKLFTAQTAVSFNATTAKCTVATPNTNMEFYPSSNGEIYQNFVVSNSISGFVAVKSANVSVGISTNQAELYLPKSDVSTNPVTVYAKMLVTNATASTKTLYYGNTNASSVGTSGGNLVSNTNNNMGHIAINTINASSNSIVSLGIPDVYALQKVYAVPDVSNIATWVDVTTRYRLDNGQRNWCYDYASIVLNPGYSHYSAASRLLVVVDRFEHSYNEMFFSAESYIGSGLSDEYADIPNFTDPVSGGTLPLRDCLDFRVVRTANTASANTANNPYVLANAVFTTSLIPHPDEVYVADYEYYLPRIDKVVLTKSKELKVIQGLPDVLPKPPSDPENSMTLYVVKYPPYVSNTELIQVHALDHKRYTMRDIGKLEKRIEHLEYYVQLSLLEERTLNQPELDGNDIERFKNGILIDPFASYSIANSSDSDYRAAIDRTMRELRPSFVSYGFKLNNFNSNNSSFVTSVGDGHDNVVMLDYGEATFISQPLASTKININPFNVTSWAGRITLSPSTDQWMDTLSRGTVTVNLFDENSNWSDAPNFGFGTIWGDWKDNWSGVSTQVNESVVFGTAHQSGDSDTREQWFKTTTTETIVSQTNTPWRTGQQIFANMSIVTKNMGDRVVDISMSPYMRSANVIIAASALKPNSELLAFFDEKDVTNYVERSNELRVANTSVASLFDIGETVSSNVAGANTGTGIIAGIVDNTLFLVNATGRFYEVGGNVNITGSNSLATAKVSGYISYSGSLLGATSTSNVTLDAGSYTVTGAYVGNTIHFTTGSAAGQISTITSFDGATGYLGVSPSFDGVPSTGSRYSIGPLKSDKLISQITEDVGYSGSARSEASVIPGSFYGLFRLPGTTRSVTDGVETINEPTVKFNTGKRIFRLTDNAAAQYATTQAEAAYDASGMTKIVENTIVATRDVSYTKGPVITQTGSPITSTTSKFETDSYFTGVYVDPLAQTFIVDPNKYANGVFITGVDLFFARKDPNRTPVTVQIRPTVNGYPSSDRWLAEVTIPSGQNNGEINVIPENITPNPANTSHTTTFTFSQPIYLLPGQEYAIVVLTNSFEYELFVGEIGKQIIGDTRIISQQPYGGSLFKSQNAKTWTPEQNQDLMFVINRADFESSGTAAFNLGEQINANSYGTNSSGNFEFDVINIQTGHLDFPPTANSTEFNLQLTSANGILESSFSSVRVDQDLQLANRSSILASNTTCLDFRVSMGTTDSAVSPVYDMGRMSFIAVRNIIDNGGLYANGFTILDAGTGFTPGQITITANDTYGTGAAVIATVNSSGMVESINVTSSGSGYIETPLLSWTASNTTNAVIVYRGETSANSNITGEQKARYISKRVTLADGFDASDIKVYISANRPPGTDIDVYYKVLATGDSTQFDNRTWTRMRVKQEQESKYATNSIQFNEYEFRTIGNTAAYTVSTNSSAQVTYDRFHTFAIKLVMRSEDTGTVPRIRNLRAIALDE